MNASTSTHGPARSELHARTAATPTPATTGTRHLGARRSRIVNTFGVLLPLVAVAIASLTLAWPGVYDEPRKVALNFVETSSTDAETPGMANVRYVGMDANDRSFFVTAGKAIHDPSRPDVIDMVEIHADMTLDNGAWMSVAASRGRYDHARQTLRLAGPVDIFSDLGYEFHVEIAHIDLGNRTVVSDAPVQGHGPFGTLHADRFRIMDGGRRLMFDDNVRMTIRPYGDG